MLRGPAGGFRPLAPPLALAALSAVRSAGQLACQSTSSHCCKVAAESETLGRHRPARGESEVFVLDPGLRSVYQVVNSLIGSKGWARAIKDDCVTPNADTMTTANDRAVTGSTKLRSFMNNALSGGMLFIRYAGRLINTPNRSSALTPAAHLKTLGSIKTHYNRRRPAAHRRTGCPRTRRA